MQYLLQTILYRNWFAIHVLQSLPVDQVDVNV